MYVLDRTEDEMRDHLAQAPTDTSPVAVTPGLVLTVPGRASYDDWGRAAKGVRIAADLIESWADKDCARASLLAVMSSG